MCDKDFLNHCSVWNRDIVLFLRREISNILGLSSHMAFHVMNTPPCAQEAKPVLGSPYLCYLDLEEPKVCPGFQENGHC